MIEKKKKLSHNRLKKSFFGDQYRGFQVHGQVLITSWVVIAILLGSATIAVRNPQTIPTEGQNFFEFVLEFIRDTFRNREISTGAGAIREQLADLDLRIIIENFASV